MIVRIGNYPPLAPGRRDPRRRLWVVRRFRSGRRRRRIPHCKQTLPAVGAARTCTRTSMTSPDSSERWPRPYPGSSALAQRRSAAQTARISCRSAPFQARGDRRLEDSTRRRSRRRRGHPETCRRVRLEPFSLIGRRGTSPTAGSVVGRLVRVVRQPASIETSRLGFGEGESSSRRSATPGWLRRRRSFCDPQEQPALRHPWMPRATGLSVSSVCDSCDSSQTSLSGSSPMPEGGANAPSPRRLERSGILALVLEHESLLFKAHATLHRISRNRRTGNPARPAERTWVWSSSCAGHYEQLPGKRQLAARVCRTIQPLP